MNEAHLMMLYWIGKPARRLSDKELQDANYLETVFRDACSWMSFTFNRDIIDWKYEVLIRKCFYGHFARTNCLLIMLYNVMYTCN